jgi:endonuclease/exonuclease/phosphatase family metal-dependent hydrolase
MYYNANMKLKVLSWNIWQGKYLDKVKEILKEQDCDILALQEIVESPDRENIAKSIANDLGYEYVYHRAFTDDRHGKSYDLGNAILSKFPIKSSEHITLSREDDYKGDSLTEPRRACKAQLKIKGKSLTILSVHLGYSRGEELTEVRKKQLESLTTVLKPTNFILMGDFNSVPESPITKKLNSMLVNTDKSSKFTKTDYSTPGNPQFRIDYIYTSPDIKALSSEIIQTDASDHKPLIATLEV